MSGLPHEATRTDPNIALCVNCQMKILELLAKLCAIVAGVLLTFITLLTCLSIIGREAFGKTVTGDFELIGVAAGAAIALFMPICQLRRANIIVDFFTNRLSEASNARLDRLGAFLLAMAFALLSWRTGVGCLNAIKTQSGTMMMGFPEWIVYAAMLPAFVLTSVIALHQATVGTAAKQRE